MAKRGRGEGIGQGKPVRITADMRRRVLESARLAIGPGITALGVGISVPTFKGWLYTDCRDRTDTECRAVCVQSSGHILARAYVREYMAAKAARRAGLSDAVIENAGRSVDRALDAGGDLAELAAMSGAGDAAPMRVGVADDGSVVLTPDGE